MTFTAQNSLFSNEFILPKTTLPDGFIYKENFISEKEEEYILKEFETIPFEDVYFKGYKAQRRVKTYGWEYNKESFLMRKVQPIPDFLLPLRKRIAQWT